MLLKIIGFPLFIYLYQEGGQGHLWTKKWAGPTVLAGINLLSAKHFSWLILIGSIGYFAAANGFSYGVKFTNNETSLKILFRGLVGASYGLCGLLIGLGTGHWILGIINILLATAGSIFFGVFSPFPESWKDWKTRAEDICIAISIIL